MITATHKGKYYDVEYSIVNVSELEGELRIDAEYYDPFYVRNEGKIIKKKWMFLGDKNVSELITDGDHGNPKYCDGGIPYLKVEEIEETGINLNSAKKVCLEYANKQSKKNYVNKNEVLITTVGTIGKVCVVNKDIKAILSRDIAKIKLSESFLLSPFYLQAFLMSKNAQILLEQISTGGLQQGLYLYQIKQMKIPIPSFTFQKFIEKLVLKAYEERQKAEQFYKQAEEILLEEMGLKNWKPKTKKIKIGGQEFEEEENISIRMLSDVIKADRMDAEYWEPKYDEIEGLIRNYKNGEDYLPNLVNISKKKIKVNKGDVYNYIELADINQNLGVVNQTKQIKGKDLPSRARMKVKKGHVIMSSVEGSIDKIALINFEKNNLVASTGFFVFEEKQLNKETLLVLLKILAKGYLIREAQGTILTAVPYGSLKRIKLPKINQQIQQKISQLIQQSFEARENSKKLLEIAKRTVEIYIEKDEEDGLNYSRNKLNELSIKVS